MKATLPYRIDPRRKDRRRNYLVLRDLGLPRKVEVGVYTSFTTFNVKGVSDLFSESLIDRSEPYITLVFTGEL